MSQTLMKVEELIKYFPIRGFLRNIGWVRAVDNVDLWINEAETLGLAGESGCGKTTLGNLLLNLMEPTSGKVFFEGREIHEIRKEDFRRKSSMVFQDPFSSLDPRMMVVDIVAEPLDVHNLASGEKREERVSEMLDVVGLSENHMYRFPHEFSGGQRQRIALARALISRPKLVVMDEPTSSLDVSVQANILNLIKRLQKEFGTSYVFISHDLSVVQHISHRTAIMYLGKIVEIADKQEMFESPQHPYSQALLSATPIPDPDAKMAPKMLKGEVPSPVNPPQGCRFHPRCPQVKDTCRIKEPKLMLIGKDHYVACHRNES